MGGGGGGGGGGGSVFVCVFVGGGVGLSVERGGRNLPRLLRGEFFLKIIMISSYEIFYNFI